MVLHKDHLLIPAGGICLALALIMDRFIGSGVLVDFFVGLLTGMSILLNLFGLYRNRKSV